MGQPNSFIRTDDSRIKDLRNGVENRNTQAVLDGDLDKFIEASLKSGLFSLKCYEVIHKERQDTSKMTDSIQNENNQEENKITVERRAKLDHIRQSCKANGHPNDFRREHLVGDLQAEFGEKSKRRISRTKPCCGDRWSCYG